MHPIHKIGRMSLQEVQRRKIFISYTMFKDERNQIIIVGASSPFFLTFNQPNLQVVKTEKVHISDALIKAHQRGRMIPTQQDMETTTPIRLRRFDTYGINPRQPFEVYQVHI